MVLILYVIYNLLRKIDAEAAGGALFQGPCEVGVGFLRQVKGIDVKIRQLEEHRLVLGPELNGDVVRVGGVVFDRIRK